jgi:hypothetical protein
MLYHSKLKHAIKGITGRKNDAWYFDRMIRNYSKGSILETREALTFGEKLAGMADDEVWEELFPGKASVNPVFRKTAGFRAGLLAREKDSLCGLNLQIIFHTPPDSFSPGFASWFSSLAETLEWMGVNVYQYWDDWDKKVIPLADLIVTHNHPLFINNFPFKAINRDRKNSCLVLSYFNFENRNEAAESSMIIQCKEMGIHGFINAAHKQFLADSSFTRLSKSEGLDTISLEFGANPLRHYPSPLVFDKADFIFLASANYEKARRNHDYLYQPIIKYQGIIAGQGWPWISNYSLDPKRDRWMYSLSKVGLNIHLQSQVDEATELNERTYILFATGIPQLIDNPALLDIHFPSYDFKSNDHKQYQDLLGSIIKGESGLDNIAVKMLEEVNTNHSTFVRVRQWLKDLGFLPAN